VYSALRETAQGDRVLLGAPVGGLGEGGVPIEGEGFTDPQPPIQPIGEVVVVAVLGVQS
jgi:hypothetical protein